METTSSTTPNPPSKHQPQRTVGPTPHTRLGVGTSSRRGGCGTVVRVSACTNPPLTSTVNGLTSHPPTTRANYNHSTSEQRITHLPHRIEFPVRNSHARRNAIRRSTANSRTCALCSIYRRRRIMRRNTRATT
jgi:hypothetical protein